jgi:hypothetical protein
LRLQDLNQFLKNKCCLEIGGPSRLLFSLYSDANAISFFNYKVAMDRHASAECPSNTKNMFFGNATEIRDFVQLNNQQFDTIISSHTLEHIANSVKALKLWYTQVSNCGTIITIVPEKQCCWDRSRDYTTKEHLMEDYNNDVTEQDMTHLHETSCMQESRPTYYSDVGDTNNARIIHHHTFCRETLIAIHKAAGFEEIFCNNLEDDKLQLVYIGKK